MFSLEISEKERAFLLALIASYADSELRDELKPCDQEMPDELFHRLMDLTGRVEYPELKAG